MNRIEDLPFKFNFRGDSPTIYQMDVNQMKWREDLSFEIRFHDERDDRDFPFQWPANPTAEVTECNRSALLTKFLKVRDNAKAILEIGICRNAGDSFTHVFLKNKKPETIYVGIDLDDKSFLNDQSKNIHTIRGTSSSVLKNMRTCYDLGIKEFDFIFIDGWHSVNQVLIDWEYTRWLSKDGIVGFHDTSMHPGPQRFVAALNHNKWNVEQNACYEDFGIGFAWKKSN